jgi:hypothetical protein
MRKGNIDLSRKLVDTALYKIKLKQIEKVNNPEKLKDQKLEEVIKNPTQVFLTGLENSKPILKIIPFKKSGISYQVIKKLNLTNLNNKQMYSTCDNRRYQYQWLKRRENSKQLI